MREKPRINQVLVRLVADRYGRRNGIAPEFRRVVVTRVGRKFFYTRGEDQSEHAREQDHEIEIFCRGFGGLYQDEQEYHDEQAADRLKKLISYKLGYSRIDASKETLQQIADMLGIDTKKEQK
jgi:hypothetical protein